MCRIHDPAEMDHAGVRLVHCCPKSDREHRDTRPGRELCVGESDAEERPPPEAADGSKAAGDVRGKICAGAAPRCRTHTALLAVEESRHRKIEVCCFL